MAGLDPKHNSRALLEGPARAAARAQLKGIGFDDEALAKPIIGVATTWTETMPCNFHHRALAAKAAGRMTEEELNELEGVASPGAGACGGQFTANTMAMAFQLLGISPMGPSDVPAQDATKAEAAYDAGKLVMDVLVRGQRPSEIITRPALENAIAGVAMSGGSTNAVLHLLAVAREAGVRPAAPACARCSRSRQRSWGRGSASRSRCSPMAASPAPRTASWPVTSRLRRFTAARSQPSVTATRS